MTMCRCEICKTVLDCRPARRVSNLQPDGFREEGFDFSCLICEAPESYILPYDPYGREDGGSV